jgi:hypothetical protein
VFFNKQLIVVVICTIQVCVLQCSFCLPEEGLLRPGKRSPVCRILNRASYLQPTLTPGDTTCNGKHPHSVLTGAHYQTSSLHNIPPHSNKGKGARVKTNGGSNQRPREELLLLEFKTAPSILPEAHPQRKRYVWHPEHSTSVEIRK